ncbi:D-aspartate oxidase-like isoform X3 [Anneissia japonica]|uniref:D-aspartate oxidase-like isoform X3 n=1 Tax=Anneissia japonica TaxID=1529436 RepID=UPI0014254B1E|nr:D-aspartate oxidase-like isoform X3 [Anneissia japonica]
MSYSRLMQEMAPQVKVVIVGGGINGFSCGVNILESLPNVEATIVSELFTPDTTGDKAAGLCLPLGVSDTPIELIAKWTKATLEFCRSLANTGEAATAGVFPHSGFYLGDATCSNLKDIFLTHQTLSKDEIRKIMPSNKSESAFITTYVLEGKLFLAWLTQRFLKYRGKTERRKVMSLSEFVGKYDVIINCAGLGSKELVSDSEVYPVRGQVIKVKAPFVKHFYIDMSEMTYIIPTSEVVTIGGTYQKGNYDEEVDMLTKKKLMEEACQLVPSLKNSEFIEDWVGFRPGRTRLRLEKEMMQFNGKTIPVIHNYGHSGAGLTLCWGCATDVVELLKQDRHLAKFSSKL